MDISMWPKPYNWMISDLRQSMDKAKANYLVGLGLFCYTEIVGRKILKFYNSEKKHFGNKECFNFFLDKYMGYDKLLKEYRDDLYDWFRNGLCHEYSIKGEKTGIHIYYDPGSLNEIEKLGIDTSRGIAIPKDNRNIRYLIVKPYLDDFIKGVKKFLKESNQI